MIGRSLHVATILGVPVKVDLSWLIIIFLLTATLTGTYSRDLPFLGWPAWLVMGFVSSMLLFGSVLAHELSHALVALRHGIPIRGITLFIFGGAAEMVEEPHDAMAELKVALAGPAMSLVLAIGFGGLYILGFGWFPEPLLEVVKYLALMNGILLAFNLVPGFPLDGGRVLRAVLWGIWGNLRYATRTASTVGSGFGVLIMFLGLVHVFPFGSVIGGIWYLFIGLFLRNAARAGYQQLLVKELLTGAKARAFMNREIVPVAATKPLAEVVDEVVLPTGLADFPVLDGGTLVGLLGVNDIRAVDRGRWRDVTAGEVMRRDVLRDAVSPDDDATRLLSLVSREDAVIPVVEGDALVGLVTRSGFLSKLKIRMDLPGA